MNGTSAESFPRLVLASASPRRADLLESLGISFERRPVGIDESSRDGEDPEAYVRRIAETKATAASGSSGELILAADTIVVLGDRLLGKPADRTAAREMLRSLSGRLHSVLTAVSIHDPKNGRLVTEVSATRVSLRALSEDEIAWYAGTGEPDDKAGGYALQGIGALFVERIEGNSSNVIGLPIPLVYDLFARLGLDLKARCNTPRSSEAS